MKVKLALTLAQFISMLTEWVKQDERCVFFSAHIISDIEHVADHIILLHEGQIILDDTMKHLKEVKAIVPGSVGLEQLMLKQIGGCA